MKKGWVWSAKVIKHKQDDKFQYPGSIHYWPNRRISQENRARLGPERAALNSQHLMHWTENFENFDLTYCTSWLWIWISKQKIWEDCSLSRRNAIDAHSDRVTWRMPRDNDSVLQEREREELLLRHARKRTDMGTMSMRWTGSCQCRTFV